MICLKKFKQIHSIIGVYLYIIKVYTSYCKYLGTGKYKVKMASKIIIYNQDMLSEALFKTYKSIDKRENTMIFRVCSLLFLFYQKLNKFNQETIGEGNTILISVNGNVKIFFDSKKEVYTFIEDKEILKKIQESTVFFAESFRMTKQNICFEKKLIIEEVVIENLSEKERNRQTIFKEILLEYNQFYILKKKISSITVDYYLVQIKEIVRPQFYEYLNNLFDEKERSFQFPIYLQHGDLHYNNILYSDEKIYYIDWETYRCDFFCYDIINFMYIDYIENSSSELIDTFMGDTLNQQILSFFSSSAFLFDNDIQILKKFCINVFLLCRILFDPCTELCCENVMLFNKYIDNDKENRY